MLKTRDVMMLLSRSVVTTCCIVREPRAAGCVSCSSSRVRTTLQNTCVLTCNTRAVEHAQVEKLVPGGLDGQSLKLIAKLRINIGIHIPHPSTQNPKTLNPTIPKPETPVCFCVDVLTSR
jgi:hypothetical protein